MLRYGPPWRKLKALFRKQDEDEYSHMAQKQISDVAAYLNSDEVINEENFLLLTECCEERAPIFPYWKYPPFELEDMNEDECVLELRFKKQDIPRIAIVLRIPE